jgi:hypothetical protein
MRIEFNLLQEKRPCSNLRSQKDIPYRNQNLLDMFLCPIEGQEKNTVIDERA